MTWMIAHRNETGQKGMFARTVRKVPQCFSSSYKANIGKASSWLRNRREILQVTNPGQRMGNMVGHARNGRMRHNFKAHSGRGRKRFPRVTCLHLDLMKEFERVRAANLKLSPQVLRHIAFSLAQSAKAPCTYAPSMQENGLEVGRKITSPWIQEFMEAHKSVIRRQTGKLSMSPESPEKQLYIEKSLRSIWEN